jgi:hypothetical protein
MFSKRDFLKYTWAAIGEMFRFRCPAGTKENVFVCLSVLTIHRHVDNRIDASRKVDQNITDNVRIFMCRKS